MKPTVFLPITRLQDSFFEHSGDTFREVVNCWEENGLVDIAYTSSNYVWFGDEETENSVLLYDRPTLEWWRRSPPQKYKCALFGNYIPTHQDQIPKSYPWIFWGRRPKMLEQLASQPRKHWIERSIISIFMGKIENQVQQAYRDVNTWRSCIQQFSLIVGPQTKYPYTQSDYLVRLSDARFGLCLRGYGPKCNREIELMALGTIPIITPDVDITGFFDPPQFGIHYLVAKNAADVSRIIASTSPEDWETMSRACQDWYQRNCSTRGSFYQTQRIIQTVSTSFLIAKPIKESWSIPPQKLPGTFRVVIDTVFFERRFSGISRVWQGLLKSLKDFRSHKPSSIEFVLLLRNQALLNLSGHYTQCFSFVGIPSFSYDHPLENDVTLLNNVCTKIGADLFISTYYTYTTVIPTIAFVHDMIPERYHMTKNVMWEQKDKCLSNANYFMCISEFTQSDLKHLCPHEKPSFVVPNAFDPAIFDGVDKELSNSQISRQSIKNELNVDLPFILVCASNAETYKNLRLVLDMIRMNLAYFNRTLTVVFLTNAEIPIQNFRVRILNSSITDRQLGLLYGLASAVIYPSKCEGFGLPVLEAFWSECPIICTHGSGAIPDIAKEGCFYVNPDDPTELFRTLETIISGNTEQLVQSKAAAGLQRLNHYTLQKQVNIFMECLREILFLQNDGASNPQLKETETTIKVPHEKGAMQTVQATPQTTPQVPQVTPQVPQVTPQVTPEVHVIVQYYNDTDIDRQNEYDFCVQANLANPSIAKLHCLLEKDTIVPEWLLTNPKYVGTRISSRLTFKQAFDYANTNLTNHICAVMNLDIFLDHNNSWISVNQLFGMSIVFCLSRHEFDGISASTKDPRLQKLAYANAQDCWMFRAPIFVKDCDFKLGMLGCDNAIAHRLKASGYIPMNSPNEFKIHHFDVCRGKQGENFLSHHAANPERPEERGYYLVPDYSALERVTMKNKDDVISIDHLIEKMGLGQIHRYRIVCDIMSAYIKLGNPPA